jgi:hypothetical protein
VGDLAIAEFMTSRSTEPVKASSPASVGKAGN